MGWKVAWSDRMVSMFTSLWVFGIFWGFFKKKIKPTALVGTCSPSSANGDRWYDPFHQ